jgi:precorrin-3B methylase
MLAIAAAVIFGISLLLDFAGVSLGDAFTTHTLITAGLFCLALHLAGVGTTVRGRSYSRR